MASKLRHAGGQTSKGMNHLPDGLVMVSDHYSFGNAVVSSPLVPCWPDSSVMSSLCQDLNAEREEAVVECNTEFILTQMVCGWGQSDEPGWLASRQTGRQGHLAVAHVELWKLG